ncbi:MAG TPA: hypothetical protein VK190_01685 [Pseudoneobacillus sp.]|nr:hypothetical protein [Pseudoneobacillus sp.]
MFGSILIRYQNNCETKENHQDESLKTHYYKGTFRQIFESVENILRQDSKYQINHVSKEHGEFSVQIKNRNNQFLIITLIAIKPLEVAVDLHISTEGFSLFGVHPQLKNEIIDFYKKLSKSTPFIGTGRSI